MKIQNYPNVLVISHNPFSNSQNNGKTLSAFFEGWPTEKLAQIFVTGSITDLNLCNNYFKISEKQMLKKIFIKKTIVGEILNSIDLSSENQSMLTVKQFKNKVIKGLIRDVLWSLKFWKTEMLSAWIDEFKPDILFYQSSSDSFMFDFVDYICKNRAIPMIMETTDDYVSLRKFVLPLSLVHHHRLVKRYKRAVKYSFCVFAISKMMAIEYENRFGGNFKIAMNCAKPQNIALKKTDNEALKIVYAGNLGLNRWKILADVGKHLKGMKDVKVDFSIYSLESPNAKMLKSMTIDGVMCFRGKANKKELEQILNDADLLVHVESFDRKNRHITRLSISTKIPEYLLSKRPILAIGPSEIASIKYLRENDLAFIISESNRNQYQEIIRRALTKSEIRDEYALKSFEFAQEHHNINLIKKRVQDSIFQALGTTFEDYELYKQL